MDQKDKDKILDSITEVGHKKFLTSSMRSQEETLNKTGLPINWISALFKKFQARWGHKFTSSIEGIEETAVNEWADGLAGLTGEQIANGLERWKEPWPPSLYEFHDSCTGKITDEFGIGYIPECYRETKRERLLESDENKAKHKKAHKSGMSGLKDILNG